MNGQLVVPPEGPNAGRSIALDSERQLVAIVGEAPGGEEEKTGRPFCGASGRELDHSLRAAGINRRDTWVTNACLCRPKDNKLGVLLQNISKKNKEAAQQAKDEGRDPPAPIPSPLDCCRPRLLQELLPYTRVITLGKTATQAVTGATASIMAIRGGLMTIDAVGDQPQRLVMPTVHPAFVLRQMRWAHVFRNDLAKAGRWFRGQSEWTPPKVTYHPSPDVLAEFLARKELIAFDLETDGIESLTAKIRCVGVGTVDEVMICGFLGKDGFTRFYEPTEEEQVKQVLTEFFIDEKRPKVGHNAGLYDLLVLQSQWGVTPKPVVDTLLLHKSAESELPHNLAYVASLYAEAPAWKTSREGDKLSTHSESDQELHLYCSVDVAITARVLPPLAEAVQLRDQVSVWQLDQKMQSVCADMHAVGMYVDQAWRIAKEKELLKRRFDLAKAIRDRLSTELGKKYEAFNPGSVQQLRSLLFERWGLTPPTEELEEEALTSSGDPSTADIVLRALLCDGTVPEVRRDFIKLVRYYRKVQKVLGTYVVKLRPANLAIEADLQWDDDEDWVDKETRKKYGLEKMGIVDPQTGRMHPGYSPLPNTGRLSCSKPFNCFDGETEILTVEGWVRFDRLQEGVKVAQRTDGGSITFVEPTAYHRGHHVGQMVKFTSQSADLLMTPEHRIPIVKLATDVVRTVEAQELLTIGPGNKTIHAGQYVGGSGVLLSDDEIRFLVALQADGHIIRLASGSDFSVEFGFKKQRKIERLRQLLRRLELLYTESQSNDESRTRFYIRQSDRLSRLVSWLGVEKLWGPKLLDFSSAQRDVFCKEVWQWDGCAERESQYASEHKQNADWVQIMLVLSGVRANVRHYRNQTGGAAWLVHVRRTDVNAITHRATRGTVSWDDMVYCVTVPDDAIIVRRNGKVTVTRQSQNVPVELRGMVCAAPGHVLVGADSNQLEVRIAAAWWGIERYLQAFREGKDPHSMTAFMIFGDAFCKVAGIDPKCFNQPGKLVGTVYKDGKFAPKIGEAYDLRHLSKTVHFSSQYMAGPPRAHKIITATEVPAKDENGKPRDDGTTDLPYAKLGLKKVREMRDNWLKGVPEYERGWARDVETWKRQGYLREPVTGRRRDFLDGTGDDGENPNEIVNFSIQSGGAGLMNLAMMELHQQIPRNKWGLGTGIIGQVHDWIGVECPESEAEWVANLLKECMTMTHLALPGVEFGTDPSIGHRWADV